MNGNSPFFAHLVGIGKHCWMVIIPKRLNMNSPEKPEVENIVNREGTRHVHAHRNEKKMHQ